MEAAIWTELHVEFATPVFGANGALMSESPFAVRTNKYEVATRDRSRTHWVPDSSKFGLPDHNALWKCINREDHCSIRPAMLPSDLIGTVPLWTCRYPYNYLPAGVGDLLKICRLGHRHP